MIIQFILSAMLVFAIAYALRSKVTARWMAMLVVLACLLGLFLVWVPQQSTQIANLLGVGRGADLILYVWIVLSLITTINIHIKFRQQAEMITTLTRELALLNASPPERRSQEPSAVTLPHSPV